MIRFFSISVCRAGMAKYKKRYAFANCNRDVGRFFTGKLMVVIFNTPELMNADNLFRLIKCRIRNSVKSQGKRSGYRLLFYADILLERVYLLYLYPKTGQYGKVDLTEYERGKIVDLFTKERASDSLQEHDVWRNMEPL